MAVKIKEGLAGGLVHQNAGHSVFLSDLQAGITYSIHQDNIICALCILCAILELCRCANLKRDVMEFHFSHTAILQRNDLRVGQLIAEGFFRIQLLDKVLILGSACVVLENRKCLCKDQPAGIRFIDLAVVVFQASNAERNPFHFTGIRGLDDLQLAIFQLVQKLVAIGFPIFSYDNFKVINSLSASASFALMHNVCAAGHVFGNCMSGSVGRDCVAF